MPIANLGHVIHRIFRIKKELGEITLNVAILSFAISMTGIFIPIYLLVLGFSLGAVFYFTAISWIVVPIAAPFVARLASGIGFKQTIFLRSPTLILWLGLITILDPAFGVSIQGLEFLVLTGLGILGGVSTALYWVLINAEFAKYSDKIHEGEEIGYFYTFVHIATIAAPLIGGIVLSTMGFGALFLIVSLIIIFSVAPLLVLDEYKGSIKFKICDTRLLTNTRLLGTFLLQGILLVGENIIWPIFVFISFGSLFTVGLAASFSALGVAIVTVFIGKFIDRMGKMRMLALGSALYPAIWIARIFVHSEIGIMALSFAGGLVFVMNMIPLFAIFCDTSRMSPIRSTVYREFWLNSGRLLLLVPAIIFPYGFGLFFIIAAAASIGIIFLVNGMKIPE